jgi:hypothetical protein
LTYLWKRNDTRPYRKPCLAVEQPLTGARDETREFARAVSEYGVLQEMHPEKTEAVPRLLDWYVVVPGLSSRAYNHCHGQFLFAAGIERV